MFNLPIKTLSINPSSYDKTGLISVIEHNYRKNPVRNAQPELGTLHHSIRDEENPNFSTPNYPMGVYAEKISEYLSSLHLKPNTKFKFYIINYSCNSNNVNMQSHFHGDCDFAAVHYVQFDKLHHKSTRFNSPFYWKDYKDYIRPNLYEYLPNDYGNSWWYDWWELDTNEDDIVFFPSLLKHEVVAHHNSNKFRITVAMNISLV